MLHFNDYNAFAKLCVVIMFLKHSVIDFHSFVYHLLLLPCVLTITWRHIGSIEKNYCIAIKNLPNDIYILMRLSIFILLNMNFFLALINFLSCTFCTNLFLFRLILELALMQLLFFCFCYITVLNKSVCSKCKCQWGHLSLCEIFKRCSHC
jgi:hypothetical protein